MKQQEMERSLIPSVSEVPGAPIIWDCGSPLYDSFELASLSHLIERHMMTLPSSSSSSYSSMSYVSRSEASGSSSEVDYVNKFHMKGMWKRKGDWEDVKNSKKAKRVKVDPICAICKNEVEDDNHLFRDCVGTCEVWEKTMELEWISNKTLRRITSWIKQLRYMESCIRDNEQRIAIHLLLSIWKSRNNSVFRDCPFNCNEVLFRAKNMDREWKFRNELTPEEDDKTKFIHR